MRLFVMGLGLLSQAAFASSLLVVAENDAAREVAGELVEPFGKAKVKVKVAGPQAPATQCLVRPGLERGRCLAQAGETAFVDGVLQLGASTTKGRTTVVFQLLSLEDGKLLKRETATGPAGNLGNALKPVVTRLSKLVRPRSASPAPQPKPEPPKPEVVVKPEPKAAEPVTRVEPPPQRPPDVPTRTVLEPTPEPTPPVVVATSSSSGLKVVAWTATGLAIAAAGVAATFGGLGLSARGELDKNEGGVSALTRAQATQLAGQANMNFTVALGSAIGAGVFGVLAAIFWSQT